MNTALFSRLLDLKIGDNTPKSTWPNREESVGVWYRKLGKYQCWEVCGEARTQYLCLANDIKEYLEKHGELVTDTVIWSAYMIGRSKSSADPTIFFCSRSSSARRTVRKEIDRSGVLDAYPWFKTADSTRPPHLEELRRLADESPTAARTAQTFPQPGQALPQPCCNLIGRRIAVSRSNASPSIPATAGAILEARNTLYITTVAHAFDAQPEDDVFSINDEQVFEFDLNESDDTDSDMEDQSGDESEFIPLSDHIHATTLDKSHDHFKDRSTDAWLDLQPLLYSDGCVVFSSSSGPEPGLDYCLLEVKDKDLEDIKRLATESNVYDCHPILPTRISSSGARDGEIIAYTGSRHAVPGTLSGTPTYLTAREGRKTQELWSVQMNGSLSVGDCGSLIINQNTAELEGHIIAGSPQTGMALIVPAHQIFNDLQQRFDKDVTLSCKCPDYAAFTSDASSMPSTASTQAPIADVNEDTGTITPSQESRSFANQIDAAGLTQQFRKTLSRKRLQNLIESRSVVDTSSGLGDKAGGATPRLDTKSTRNLPIFPRKPSTAPSSKFAYMLEVLAKTPLRWENPEVLDRALRLIPLDQLYANAQEEQDLLEAEARFLNKRAALGYHDCVIRELSKWFKRDFFTWVNHPECSSCQSPTISRGRVTPIATEEARGALKVELYQCANAQCQAFERFPRYNDPYELLRTRRGRVGEWANCFGLLCRALGSRVRWIWNLEDHVWVEVYSEHHQRWIHVDCCEEVWDMPLLYTQGKSD